MIEERLKKVMILAIEQRNPHRRATQRLGRLQAAEAAADDYHSRQIALMDIHNFLLQ